MPCYDQLTTEGLLEGEGEGGRGARGEGRRGMRGEYVAEMEVNGWTETRPLQARMAFVAFVS